MNRLMYDAFDRFLTPFRKLHSNYSREIFFSLIQQIKLQLLITNYYENKLITKTEKISLRTIY